MYNSRNHSIQYVLQCPRDCNVSTTPSESSLICSRQVVTIDARRMSDTRNGYLSCLCYKTQVANEVAREARTDVIEASL